MKKCIWFLLLLCGIATWFSCKSKHAADSIAVTSDTAKFYPVNDYFKAQLQSVITSNAFIYKITINDNKGRDSSVLTRQQFAELAQAFLQYDISDKSIHKYYKENVFIDETTHSYTFNYNAMDSTLPLQRVDVLLDADDQHVTRVFINKVSTNNDSTITEKAGWKTGNSFFINRYIDYANNKTTTQQNIIVWRNQP